MLNSNEQIAFLQQKIGDLSKKANLSTVPDLWVSKTERLANVNVFQRRISVGENLLALWKEGKFEDTDMEATLAHEIGHLMDFRVDSRSRSFRNLLFESLWFAFGIVPLVIYLLSPSLVTLLFAGVLAICWGFTLPWVVRRVEVGIELEADRNAALYLVRPEHLANALTRISSFGIPSKKLGLTAQLSFLAGTLTHPTFKERVKSLQNMAV